MSSLVKVNGGERPILQNEFCAIQPDVVATFGGNEALYLRWWEDIALLDTPDNEFIYNYSTNDRFLKNRLILPEEVPFLILPILKAALRNGYQTIFFVERGTHPYLWALHHLVPSYSPTLRLESIRIKGLTRESHSCNLLTLAAKDPEDADLLTKPLTRKERNAVKQFLSPRRVELPDGSTREEMLRALADKGLDPCIRIPNLMKTVVFEAGNLLRKGPLTVCELKERINPSLYALAPNAQNWVNSLIEGAIGSGGTIDFAGLLDGMNHCVRQIRGKLTHAYLSALNYLLKQTRTACHLFNSKQVLVVEEISVCGSTCLALEALGQAFNPAFHFDFGAIVGMSVNESFLDVVSASYFSLKPLEDTPFLSPFCFVPVYSDHSIQSVKPHRFPSCTAVSPIIRYWKQTTAEEMLANMSSGVGEEEKAHKFEAEVIASVRACVDCDGFPLIERRQNLNSEVLSTLVSYYLGCFTQIGEQTQFRHDPILEARLEGILDSAGRHQKPFYHDMDRFFTNLHEAEKRFPDKFLAWRTALSIARTGIAYRVLSNAIQDREQYAARMQLGLEAVARCQDAVEQYLFSPFGKENDFKQLLSLLQGKVQ